MNNWEQLMQDWFFLVTGLLYSIEYAWHNCWIAIFFLCPLLFLSLFLLFLFASCVHLIFFFEPRAICRGKTPNRTDERLLWQRPIAISRVDGCSLNLRSVVFLALRLVTSTVLNRIPLSSRHNCHAALISSSTFSPVMFVYLPDQCALTSKWVGYKTLDVTKRVARKSSDPNLVCIWQSLQSVPPTHSPK